MANRPALAAASERLRHVMEEVMELEPSGAAIMRTAYSVIYPESQRPPPSSPPTKGTAATGTPKAATATQPIPSSKPAPKAEQKVSKLSFSDSDSDSPIHFVSLLEPGVTKNITSVRGTQSTPPSKSKKRKAEKKAPVETESEKKKARVGSDDPFAKVEAIANNPKSSPAKKGLAEQLLFDALERPITPAKSKKR